jgi:DNA-binding MltR family transcriptional regulator
MTDNDKLSDTWFEKSKKALDFFEPFVQTLARESDRAVVIVAAIMLDNLLEQLIKNSYVRDPKVNTIFKDEHILQSFHTKISIAYFSGLIPKALYHDLKLICEIRNKFAHDVVADLKFDDKRIVQRINQFSQIGEELVKTYPPKLSFLLNVSHIAGLLLSWCQFLSKERLPNLVTMLKLEEKQFAELILTPEQLQNIFEPKRDNPR